MFWHFDADLELHFKLLKAFLNLCACSQSLLWQHAWNIPSKYFSFVWRSTSFSSKVSLSIASCCFMRVFSIKACLSFASRCSLSFSCFDMSFLNFFFNLLFDHDKMSMFSLPNSFGSINNFITSWGLSIIYFQSGHSLILSQFCWVKTHEWWKYVLTAVKKYFY